MNFKNKLIPIPFGIIQNFPNKDLLGNHIRGNTFELGFPDIQESPCDFVIIGATLTYDIDLQRNYHSLNNLRQSLYGLFKGQYEVKIADWGNIVVEEKEEDTIANITEIISVIHELGAIPIIIGGEQHITYANYLSYKNQKKYVTLALIDSRIDFDGGEDQISRYNFLNHIIYDNQNRLFDLSILGYQNYLVSPTIAETMRSLGFELMRLADIRANIDDAEPAIRAADFVSIDMSSVRNSDAPSAYDSSPNGLRGEELCKISRFAGMSGKLSTFGIYNLKPSASENEITAQLAAQIIWHFIDGFYSRILDSPDFDSQDYIRYDVNAIDNGVNLRFYKNKISGRWWIGIPVEGKKIDLYNMKEYRIPCSQNDYFQASQNEIPEKWLNSYKKLHD